jgi:hypothetical protein
VKWLTERHRILRRTSTVVFAHVGKPRVLQLADELDRAAYQVKCIRGVIHKQRIEVFNLYSTLSKDGQPAQEQKPGQRWSPAKLRVNFVWNSHSPSLALRAAPSWFIDPFSVANHFRKQAGLPSIYDEFCLGREPANQSRLH